MTETEYFEIQKRHESFESNVARYAIGQRRFLNNFFLKDVPKTARILDLACGDGVGLKWFLDNGYTDVCGVENNDDKLKAAQQHGFPILKGDMHKLRLQPESYDIIYTSHTMEHARQPKVVLSLIRNALKLNGHLYIVVPFPDTSNDIVHCGKFELKTDISHANQENGYLHFVHVLTQKL